MSQDRMLPLPSWMVLMLLIVVLIVLALMFSQFIVPLVFVGMLIVLMGYTGFASKASFWQVMLLIMVSFVGVYFVQRMTVLHVMSSVELGSMDTKALSLIPLVLLIATVVGLVFAKRKTGIFGGK